LGRGSLHKIPAQRRAELLAILLRRGAASISELAGEIGVSESTVRRDLDELSAGGRVRRTRGGAVVSGRTAFEPLFADRSRQNPDEKRRIGRHAVSLLEAGQSVIFDSSSTVLCAAEAVAEGGPEVTAVTNDVGIAAALASGGGSRVIVTGGEVREGSFTLVGPVAREFLGRLHVDVLLLGIHAVVDGSLSEAGIGVAEIKRAMIRAARRVVLLADHSKFGDPAFFEVAGVEVVDDLITDRAVPEEALEALREATSARIHLV
jgi:DeoR family transcriptional regulator of aga operon